MINLDKILAEKIEKLERQITKTAEERDESATPTESTHDQTRQIANQLFNSLLEEKAAYLLLVPKVKRFKKIFKVENLKSKIDINIFVVPDGLGGIMVDGTLLIGESSPIAQVISKKNINESYQFNEVDYLVVDIYENS